MNGLDDIFSRLGFKVIEPVDTSPIDKLLLDDSGHIKVVPARTIDEIAPNALMTWCAKNAIYQIPTEELINWLQQRIGNRKAIEIGSGRTGIGRALGIPCTDSYIQTTPEMKAYYEALQQAPVIPPDYVEKLEARQAIEKYKPEVVLACFVTQKHKEGELQGCAFGLDEEWIVGTVPTYIHVGNRGPHGSKRILAIEHEEFQFPWLKCRAIDPSKNFIAVWNNK